MTPLKQQPKLQQQALAVGIWVGILFLNASFEAGARLPVPQKNACGFYLELELALDCQGKNQKDQYLTQFAYPYCQKFKAAKAQFDPGLKFWVESTTECLQQKLVDAARRGVSCRDLERAALDSHRECYVDAGYCELGFGQKTKVMKLISMRDLFRQTTRGQPAALEIQQICLSR
jgi:hypothetical protein